MSGRKAIGGDEWGKRERTTLWLHACSWMSERCSFHRRQHRFDDVAITSSKVTQYDVVPFDYRSRWIRFFNRTWCRGDMKSRRAWTIGLIEYYIMNYTHPRFHRQCSSTGLYDGTGLNHYFLFLCIITFPLNSTIARINTSYLFRARRFTLT